MQRYRWNIAKFGDKHQSINKSITNNGTKGHSIAWLKLPVDIAKMQEVLKKFFTYIVSNIFKL